MEEFLSSEASGLLVVARLPLDIQAHLQARTGRVFLTAETRDSHRKHGWTADDLARLQTVFDHGEVRADRDRHVVVAYLDDVWWYAVVKVTPNRHEVYLQSYRRSNDDQIANVRQRAVLIRKGSFKR